MNVEIAMHPDLLNSRFAYVAVSRASHDAEIYTNDATNLGHKLSGSTEKTSAVEFSRSAGKSATEIALIQNA